MPAYMIVNLEVHDAAAFDDYKARVPALIEKHGGECLSRGGKVEIFEGKWQPNRLVVFRFPNLESIRAFNDDPEYLPLKKLRQSSAYTELVSVEGI